MFIMSIFKTPIGTFAVEHDEHYIYHAKFVLNRSDFFRVEGTLGNEIALQLNTYFKNPLFRFQLPLKPMGSLFQQHVWNELLVIPVGRTLTYGELASKLQTSPRAIGQACKSNQVPLFIPCHRVVGKIAIGGYMGCPKAVAIKQALLQHEGYEYC